MSQNKKKNQPKAKHQAPAQSQSQPQVQTQAIKSSQKGQSSPSAWQSYNLDQKAQKLVLDALAADKDCLNQSYKMRMAVSYGLERFWGEHLRLHNSKKGTDQQKSEYWKATWDELVGVMGNAGVVIPNPPVSAGDTNSVRAMSESLWQLDTEVQRVSLAVLTQLCDCIVWWTQRYKGIK
jgi:hypothetical protein